MFSFARGLLFAMVASACFTARADDRDNAGRAAAAAATTPAPAADHAASKESGNSDDSANRDIDPVTGVDFSIIPHAGEHGALRSGSGGDFGASGGLRGNPDDGGTDDTSGSTDDGAGPDGGSDQN